MTDFRIELEDQAAAAALAELQRKGADLSELMGDIARALRNAAEDAFEDQRGPFGDAWDDLQPETKKRRAKSGHWPGSILQLSGGLAGSVGGDAGRDWAEVGAGKECRGLGSGLALRQINITDGLSRIVGLMHPQGEAPLIYGLE